MSELEKPESAEARTAAADTAPRIGPQIGGEEDAAPRDRAQAQAQIDREVAATEREIAKKDRDEGATPEGGS